jgi:hypothetical protein
MELTVPASFIGLLCVHRGVKHWWGSANRTGSLIIAHSGLSVGLSNWHDHIEFSKYLIGSFTNIVYLCFFSTGQSKYIYNFTFCFIWQWNFVCDSECAGGKVFGTVFGSKRKKWWQAGRIYVIRCFALCYYSPTISMSGPRKMTELHQTVIGNPQEEGLY